MFFEVPLRNLIKQQFQDLFQKPIDDAALIFQPTRKEFEGDITLVVFSLGKLSGKAPDETGRLLGEALVKEGSLVSHFNIIKGFLNISIHNNLFLNNLNSEFIAFTENLNKPAASQTKAPVLVEYSSPNTNKPLHLGHIRNNLLGYSIYELLQATGNKVVKVNIINDRGIHICKSMLAWQKFGNGETPESSGMKGDHLVGKYYVAFDQHYRQQIKQLEADGWAREEAEKKAPLILEAQEMLRKWEEGDPQVLELWNTMNRWVYAGFDVTYKRLGVDFDKIYYESQTYLLGKKIVEEGLAKGVLFRKPDGSVWVDLKADGLDEKLLLRADGTSVYMTQDLGTAVMRYEEFKFDKLIYVVGNEQDYHFKVLFLILKKLGYEWADRLYHLSYNMVDLPSGKMKSREGTVVDADELISEMVNEARKLSIELGKLDDFDSPEALRLFEILGLGALKYFILKVDPEKRMLFNPNESIDFNGNTGPFIQYTHARIRSVLRKAESMGQFKGIDAKSMEVEGREIEPKEKEMIRTLLRYPGVLQEAASRYSPALVANYGYELAKTFNQYYHDHAIIDPANVSQSTFRLRLCRECALVISHTMKMLGITVPERM